MIEDFVENYDKSFGNLDKKEVMKRLYIIYLLAREPKNRDKLEHICGISHDGGMVYELTERRWDGYILRQGWRRVLKMLIAKNITSLKKASSEFGTSFEGNCGRGFTVEKDPITKAMDEAKQRGYSKTGVEDYVELDNLVDIHRMREKYRQDKSNYWA